MRGWGSNDGNSSASDGEGSREKSMEARLFSVSVDVRGFKANMHLPTRSANVFVRVVLPPEIVRVAMESCIISSKVTAPLRTHPPVLVNRGTEVTIPNGYVALDLPASPHHMAAMLALQPEVTAHVLHRDKYAADSILGVALIPMKQLMEHPLVDGYAPVQGVTSVGGKIKDVKIGSLHVVLAIEDMGLVKGLESTKCKIASAPRHLKHPLLVDPNVADLKTGYIFGSARSSSAEEGELHIDHSPEYIEEGEVQKQPSVTKTGAPCNKRQKCKSPQGKKNSSRERLSTSPDAEETIKKARVHGEEGVRNRPEYEMAWEFEMWRRSEEAKWQADLKEKEFARMTVLEEEWRKCEKEHIIELQNSQAEQADLEAKLRAKLFKLEKRERAIILAEEENAHRREFLERALANRTSDVQVAGKRLQVECEHRVDLERSKYVALQEQYTLVEQRLAISNCSLATVEKQFQEFKAVQRNTLEAELVGQIIALKQQCGDLQRKVELAWHARDDYKAQVLKMAKELARLHHDRNEAHMLQATQIRNCLESRSLANLIESQSQEARQDRLELQQLKDQLNALQLREQESISVDATLQTSQKSLRILDPKDLKVQSNNTSPPIRKSNLPKLDLSKVIDTTDRILPTDLRIFQDTKTNLENAVFSPATWPRQPLAEMGQKLKDPVPANLKGGCPTMETRYHDLRLIDIESEDHALYDSECSTKGNKCKIEYLLNQKSDLLKTGVYSSSDRVIRGLDQEIQHLRTGGKQGLNPYENPTMSP